MKKETLNGESPFSDASQIIMVIKGYIVASKNLPEILLKQIEDLILKIFKVLLRFKREKITR
ncbi:hypothetical protein KEJ50_06280 [Candidatus Bathyarchaeota archaeon]|nr:hypothetical protein [Candidatus Bathyarchaeota archaeon]